MESFPPPFFALRRYTFLPSSMCYASDEPPIHLPYDCMTGVREAYERRINYKMARGIDVIHRDMRDKEMAYGQIWMFIVPSSALTTAIKPSAFSQL